MSAERLTKEQAAIIGAYTAVACGPFDELHEYIERIMKRPVYTHELGDSKVWEQIKQNARGDFLSICRIDPVLAARERREEGN